MRALFLALCLALPGIAVCSETVLPALPEPDLPITETVTNVALAVDFARLEKLTFTLSLDASPSNNYLLAIGTDRNEDGCLSLEEADVTFGYDCGSWVEADTETGNVTETPSATEGRVTHSWTFNKRTVNRGWTTLKLIRRGMSAMGEMTVKEIENEHFSIILR